MMLMVCSDPGIIQIVKILKTIFQMIQIFGPVLAIVSLGVIFFSSITAYDEKTFETNKRKIRNCVLALLITFFLPIFVNLVMGITQMKNTFEVSSCWTEVDSYKPSIGSYVENESDKDRTRTYIINPGEYSGTDDNPNSGYESMAGTSTTSTDSSDDTPSVNVDNCGNLEYCNKFLSIMYSNSTKLDDAIIKNKARVTYSNSHGPKSWSEAIKIAKRGGLVRTSCNRPAHWGIKGITGEYKDIYSTGRGGFKNYNGKLTKYTKQIKFNESISVKKAIQKGKIQSGDIIGVSNHTFVIYKTNKDGSAIVFDGGHRYTNRCQNHKKCSMMFKYSSDTTSGLTLYQIIRWTK